MGRNHCLHLFFALTFVIISSCIAPNENTNSEIKKAQDSCQDLSVNDKAYLNNLLATISAFDSGLTPSGETHPQAMHNIIYEVGKIGCPEAIPVLTALGDSIDQTSQIANDGVIDLEFQGPRVLRSVFEAFGAIGSDSSEVRALLVRYAEESRLIRDGQNGRALQNAARSALDLIDNQSYDLAPVSSFHYSWNAGYSGSCSSTYLQTDGSRVSFIGNWSTYADQIASLTPTQGILRSFLFEPCYADGSDGYVIQKAALSSFLTQASASLRFSTEMDLLEGTKIRGFPLAQGIVSDLDIVSPHNDRSALERMLELISGPNRHPDEKVRTSLIITLKSICRERDSNVVSFCEHEVKTIFRDLIDGDLYKAVRMGIATENY